MLQSAAKKTDLPSFVFVLKQRINEKLDKHSVYEDKFIWTSHAYTLLKQGFCVSCVLALLYRASLMEKRVR